MMDKDTLIKYAPSIIVILIFAFEFNVFVTPEKLEIKHRQILEDVQKTYVTKDQYDDLKEQLRDVQTKVDKMYDVIVGGKDNGNTRD